jgi:hypothetical protein
VTAKVTAEFRHCHLSLFESLVHRRLNQRRRSLWGTTVGGAVGFFNYFSSPLDPPATKPRDRTRSHKSRRPSLTDRNCARLNRSSRCYSLDCQVGGWPRLHLTFKLTATSRTRPWPAAGWGCRGRRLSRERGSPYRRVANFTSVLPPSRDLPRYG